MKKTCIISKNEFDLTKFELNFYNQFDLPIPEISPNERRRQRLAFRNESSIYHRICDATKKDIISMYRQDSGYLVFDNEQWWQMEALNYGRDYDSNRDFFTQFHEFNKSVPKMARIQQGENDNSRYTNCASNNKNCYLIYSSNNNQDCLYGRSVNSCRNCIDNFSITNCELCYSCSHCFGCYNLQFSNNSQNCYDSYYLNNCISCKYCFGCSNLINKEYCLFNKQLTKDRYNTELDKMDLNSYKFRENIKNYLNSFNVYAPEFFGNRNEDVDGNYIYNSKNIYNSVYIRDCEDIQYCNDVNNLKNSLDISFYGATGENINLYQAEGVGHNVQNIFFSKLIWGGSSNVYYSYECFNCQDIFACAGLRKKRFCIFNKQYTESEYNNLKSKIINNMKKNNEWGSFFPYFISPFAYNETVANDFFPLKKQDCLELGSSWLDLNFENKVSEFDDILPEKCPNKIYYCEKTHQGFKIMEQEFSYLSKNKISLPRKSPNQRFIELTSRANINICFNRECLKCSNKLNTYNSGNILCKDCYLNL